MSATSPICQPCPQHPTRAALLAEYAELSGRVHDALTAVRSLVTPSLFTVILGWLVATGEGWKDPVHAMDGLLPGWLVVLLPLLLLSVLVLHWLRGVAEFHALGGYKWAIEETLNRLCTATPRVWEGGVVEACGAFKLARAMPVLGYTMGMLLASWLTWRRADLTLGATGKTVVLVATFATLAVVVAMCVLVQQVRRSAGQEAYQRLLLEYPSPSRGPRSSALDVPAVHPRPVVDADLADPRPCTFERPASTATGIGDGDGTLSVRRARSEGGKNPIPKWSSVARWAREMCLIHRQYRHRMHSET